MNEIRWGVQAMLWPISYAFLLFAYQFVERWLVARFQQRSTVALLPAQAGKNRGTAIVLLVALLAGAIVPLAPEIAIAEWRLQFHVLGDSSVALLVILVIQWLGEGCLVLLTTHERKEKGLFPGWQLFGAIYFDILPIMLIVLGLLFASKPSSMHLTAWIAAQDGWNGLGWMTWAQPLLSLLWLICARPPHLDAPIQATWAYKALSLNRVLLACALFFGGWQGPFVNQLPWLGFLYTAVKVGGVTLIWTWMRVSLPRPSLSAHIRTIWQVWMPLAILNLIVIALFVVNP